MPAIAYALSVCYNSRTLQTFINLPPLLQDRAAAILADTSVRDVTDHARSLHTRYMSPTRGTSPLLKSTKDMLAYLSLRFPATYAQICGALSQVRERMPDWNPMSVLDLGSGPGTGLFAAKTVWPTVSSGTAIDQEQFFHSLGEDLSRDAYPDVAITRVHRNVATWAASPGREHHDLIIVANVLNELSIDTKNTLLETLARLRDCAVVILEPGTGHGFEIIQNSVERVAKHTALIAPYINNSHVKSSKYWIHFSQRFIRPEFTRRLRQTMRDSPLMASDWEEATYAYAAFGSIPVTRMPYAVTIGDVERYPGYLMIPVLTERGPEKMKVMKRHKAQYAFAKKLRWGETLPEGFSPVNTR